MEQLLAHLTGDYLLQTGWMANNKEKATLPCLVHCLLYSLCFLIFCKLSWIALLVVFASHMLIDRFGLVKRVSNWEMNPLTPDYIKFFVGVARDNTVHLICNYFAIMYL